MGNLEESDEFISGGDVEPMEKGGDEQSSQPEGEQEKSLVGLALEFLSDIKKGDIDALDRVLSQYGEGDSDRDKKVRFKQFKQVIREGSGQEKWETIAFLFQAMAKEIKDDDPELQEKLFGILTEIVPRAQEEETAEAEVPSETFPKNKVVSEGDVPVEDEPASETTLESDSDNLEVGDVSADKEEEGTNEKDLQVETVFDDDGAGDSVESLSSEEAGIASEEVGGQDEGALEEIEMLDDNDDISIDEELEKIEMIDDDDSPSDVDLGEIEMTADQKSEGDESDSAPEDEEVSREGDDTENAEPEIPISEVNDIEGDAGEEIEEAEGTDFMSPEEARDARIERIAQINREMGPILKMKQELSQLQDAILNYGTQPEETKTSEEGKDDEKDKDGEKYDIRGKSKRELEKRYQESYEQFRGMREKYIGDSAYRKMKADQLAARAVVESSMFLKGERKAEFLGEFIGRLSAANIEKLGFGEKAKERVSELEDKLAAASEEEKSSIKKKLILARGSWFLKSMVARSLSLRQGVYWTVLVGGSVVLGGLGGVLARGTSGVMSGIGSYYGFRARNLSKKIHVGIDNEKLHGMNAQEIEDKMQEFTLGYALMGKKPTMYDTEYANLVREYKSRQKEFASQIKVRQELIKNDDAIKQAAGRYKKRAWYRLAASIGIGGLIGSGAIGRLLGSGPDALPPEEAAELKGVIADAVSDASGSEVNPETAVNVAKQVFGDETGQQIPRLSDEQLEFVVARDDVSDVDVIVDPASSGELPVASDKFAEDVLGASSEQPAVIETIRKGGSVWAALQDMKSSGAITEIQLQEALDNPFSKAARLAHLVHESDQVLFHPSEGDAGAWIEVVDYARDNLKMGGAVELAEQYQLLDKPLPEWLNRSLENIGADPDAYQISVHPSVDFDPSKVDYSALSKTELDSSLDFDPSNADVDADVVAQRMGYGDSFEAAHADVNLETFSNVYEMLSSQELPLAIYNSASGVPAKDFVEVFTEANLKDGIIPKLLEERNLSVRVTDAGYWNRADAIEEIHARLVGFAKFVKPYALAHTELASGSLKKFVEESSGMLGSV